MENYITRMHVLIDYIDGIKDQFHLSY
ncbi:MAG: hypothetical protein RIQ68_1250, partial [Pseudomonadota bacterium]